VLVLTTSHLLILAQRGQQPAAVLPLQGLTQQVGSQNDYWQINCNQAGADGYALVQLHPYDRGLWPRLLHSMLC